MPRNTLTVDRNGFSKFTVKHGGFNYHITHNDERHFVSMKGVMQIDQYMSASLSQEIERRLKLRREAVKIVDRFKEIR